MAAILKRNKIKDEIGGHAKEISVLGCYFNSVYKKLVLIKNDSEVPQLPLNF